MPIHPLPQFETDLKQLQDERDREAYERLKPPDTIVVRFGSMKMIGEFKYFGDAKPGCGSKIVVRTFRGTEIGEMLTSTCPNAGCSKSVTRQEMLEYIENSGGRKYPFSRNGRALRVATAEDLDAQAKIEQSRHPLKLEARRLAHARSVDAKIVEVEPIIGNEQTTVYYTTETSPDIAPLQRDLADSFGTRVEMRQVGARDEARLAADYERCGQYCCCKNFLKVLKPISMRSAKTQKATLDPLKISGRCGRLMCCLRYEDETYETLRKRLPKRKKHIGTPEGDGIVIDTQILTQLVLVKLDGTEARVAVPVEEITEPTGKIAQPAAGNARSARQPSPGDARAQDRDSGPKAGPSGSSTERSSVSPSEGRSGDQTDTTKKKRKRRRRKPGGNPPSGQASGSAPESEDRSGSDARAPGRSEQAGDDPAQPGQQPGDQSDGSAGQGAKKKRRRRRKRRPGSGPGGDSSQGPSDGAPPRNDP